MSPRKRTNKHQQQARKGALAGLLKEAAEAEYLGPDELAKYISDHRDELGISEVPTPRAPLNLADLKAGVYSTADLEGRTDEALQLLNPNHRELPAELSMAWIKGASRQELTDYGLDKVQDFMANRGGRS